ncbi:MAG: FG-GAP repeat protein, partial [Verrucomicrobia bacterium]|nr:FG-GAP repeat protein [Verrucomicrobiota bacterium]
RGGSGWSEQAKLIASDGATYDWFSYSVALSGDGNTVLIGAHSADVVAGVGTNNNQGAAYVFTRGGGWSEQAKLIASDGATNDWFGSSVALSSDGNTAIIGASWADVGVSTNQGAVYVFTQGGGWSEQAKLIASDGAEGDYFGQVALSSDGNTALIGVHMSGYANQGAGYVFTRYLGNWSEQKKLTVAAWTAGDYFGWSVALNSDGNTALIGAYPAVVGSVMSGAGYVFTRSGTAWTQQATLTAADGAEWDDFGYSVALSSDGNTALIGALDADVGGNADQGAGYVFTRSGTSWSQQAKLAALDGTAYDYFGHSVALSGDGNTALITEPGWIYSTNQGAGYVFTVTASSKIGPIIKANGATNNVTVNYPETVSITVEMNADIYAGAEVDWWVVAYAHSVGCYYLNSAMQWTPFSGDLAFCRPVYQSALFNLSSTPVLSGFVLPRGTYDFWFAVDYPMDGVLDPNGQILYDKVTIVVQ